MATEKQFAHYVELIALQEYQQGPRSQRRLTAKQRRFLEALGATKDEIEPDGWPITRELAFSLIKKKLLQKYFPQVPVHLRKRVLGLQDVPK